jgi:hypothetical protein
MSAATLTKMSEIPGAKIALESCRWAPDQQPSNSRLVLLLGTITGRCRPSVGASYSERGTPDDWLTLRQVDEAAIEAELARLRKVCPEWRLEGGGAETLVDQLDHHFRAAQGRRER